MALRVETWDYLLGRLLSGHGPVLLHGLPQELFAFSPSLSFSLVFLTICSGYFQYDIQLLLMIMRTIHLLSPFLGD